ncbi:hypothetical protein L1887_12491 [Cichorium endivia]|nr:hypothetical protein L1887_12491 [Cichorium endivia]
MDHHPTYPPIGSILSTRFVNNLNVATANLLYLESNVDTYIKVLIRVKRQLIEPERPMSSNLAALFPGRGSEEQHNEQAYGDRPVSRIPPNEAAGIVVVLKDKSASELQKLLSNKDAYQQFLHSLDIAQNHIRLRDELRNETMQLAKHNLDKEPHIRELRNQCQIIRATELATAREKLNELEKQKKEILSCHLLQLTWKTSLSDSADTKKPNPNKLEHQDLSDH